MGVYNPATGGTKMESVFASTVLVDDEKYGRYFYSNANYSSGIRKRNVASVNGSLSQSFLLTPPTDGAVCLDLLAVYNSDTDYRDIRVQVKKTSSGQILFDDTIHLYHDGRGAVIVGTFTGTGGTTNSGSVLAPQPMYFWEEIQINTSSNGGTATYQGVLARWNYLQPA